MLKRSIYLLLVGTLLLPIPLGATETVDIKTMTQDSVVNTVKSVVHSMSSKWKSDPFEKRAEESLVDDPALTNTAPSTPGNTSEKKPVTTEEKAIVSPPSTKSSMELKGIFKGKSGTRALISGKMVRVGDKLNSDYRVKSILSQSVILEDSNGLTITLEFE